MLSTTYYVTLNNFKHNFRLLLLKEAQVYHEIMTISLGLAQKTLIQIGSFIYYISTAFFLSYLTLSGKVGGTMFRTNSPSFS